MCCFAVQPYTLRCVPLLTKSSPHGFSKRLTIALASRARGFGKESPPRSSDDEDEDGPSSSTRPRMRKQRKQMAPGMPSPEQRFIQQEAAFDRSQQLQQQQAEQAENAEFAERLQVIKARAAEKRSSAGTGPTPPGASSQVAAFDVSPLDYTNPPSLQNSLLTQLNDGVSDPALRDAKVGPNQIGIAASAIVFGLVFVLVAGGDFVPSNRYKGVRPTQAPLDTVSENIIKTRISQLEDNLRLNPKDVEATQALAFSYAQLLQYDKAAAILEKLTAKDPTNPSVWRLLGETSLLAEQSGKAVKAYERAVALRDDDLQIYTGLVDAWIADGKHSKAVDLLNQLRQRVPNVSALGVVAKDAPAAGSAAASTSAASVMQAITGADPVLAAPDLTTTVPSSTESTAGPSGSQVVRQSVSSNEPTGLPPPIRPLEPVSVELLLAKTYSSWRGHDSDALATYDALIARFPEDFRGYLAKGVFLREKGRRADAERMFLQARFWAPENRQQFIRETAETRPVLDIPGND